MPGLVAPITDEREALLAFLGQQRDALRYAAHGLDDAQASARPAASELCLAGLIKHVALVERAWTTFIVSGDTQVFNAEEDYVDGVPPGGYRDDGRRHRPLRRPGQSDREDRAVQPARPRRLPPHHRGCPLDPGRAGLDAAARCCSTWWRRRPGMPVDGGHRAPVASYEQDLLDAHGRGRRMGAVLVLG